MVSAIKLLRCTTGGWNCSVVLDPPEHGPYVIVRLDMKLPLCSSMVTSFPSTMSFTTLMGTANTIKMHINCFD